MHILFVHTTCVRTYDCTTGGVHILPWCALEDVQTDITKWLTHKMSICILYHTDTYGLPYYNTTTPIVHILILPDIWEVLW